MKFITLGTDTGRISCKKSNITEDMKILTREEILNLKWEEGEDSYIEEIFAKEKHHEHELVMDGTTLRWKKSSDVDKYLSRINLNDLIMLLHSLGYDKNSEVYRHLYRSMGYSLYGYWEVFYWEVNNEKADKYVPKKKFL